MCAKLINLQLEIWLVFELSIHLFRGVSLGLLFPSNYTLVPQMMVPFSCRCSSWCLRQPSKVLQVFQTHTKIKSMPASIQSYWPALFLVCLTAVKSQILPIILCGYSLGSPLHTVVTNNNFSACSQCLFLISAWLQQLAETELVGLNFQKTQRNGVTQEE